MDAGLHAIPPDRPRTSARWIPFARTTALVATGIGVGVLASIPTGGGGALPVVVAVVAATAAALIASLRPWNAPAIAVADVLLGLALLATVFGHLAVLYLPILLAFLWATSRIEPGARTAPQGKLKTEAGPVSPLEWDTTDEPAEEEPFEVPPLAELGVPEPIPADEVVRVETVAIAVAPRPEPERTPGRHRAPAAPRRLAAATVRAGRAIGAQARVGVANLRGALGPGPDDVEPPVPEPPADDGPGADPSMTVVPGSELDELRHELEERELELVAAGKGMGALVHRAYGELRFLPAQPPTPPSPPPREGRTIQIDDADWDAPSWKTIGED